ARVLRANPRRSVRQFPDGSGASASACTFSSISWCSSSLEPTYQYSDIAPTLISRAIRRMLTASVPSASATAIAVSMMSGRLSPRTWRGAWPRCSIRLLTCSAIRRSRSRSRRSRRVPPTKGRNGRKGSSSSMTAPRQRCCPAAASRAVQLMYCLSYTVLPSYGVLPIVQRTRGSGEGSNGGPAIEAEGLVKRYGKTQALSGFDLTVPTGTVYGLLGPNGAGKTTAVRVLATLLRPDAGRARVLGHDVLAQAPAVRRTIGLTRQSAPLHDSLPARTAESRTGRSNLTMTGQLSRLTAKAARRRADELLERFGLTDAAGRAVKTYSGGMRRRLDLAASLIGHPAVLFLDEPTTGLDPSARALMWVIVRELVADGTTLLLTTQYLDEADQLAGRIAVIDGGKVIAEGTPGELKASISGHRILLTVAEGADLTAAAMALEPFSSRSIIPNGAGRLIEVPVA